MGQEVIFVAEFKPDMPDLAEATSIALNVIAVTPQSYGPLGTLTSYSTNAMDGQCLGAISVGSVDLVTSIFAGTPDKLYQLPGLNHGNPMLDSAGNPMVDSAGNPMYDSAGSYTAGWADVSGQVYDTALADGWEFDIYNNTVIATNFADDIQAFNLSTSTVFRDLFTAPAWAVSTVYGTLGVYVLANGNRYVLVVIGTSAASGTGPSGTGVGITDGTAIWDYQSSAPPKARHMCTPKNFLMLANTNDPVGGLAPQRLWWSASGDATSFPAPGSNAAIQSMSDFNDFHGDFEEIVGVVDSLANADVAIFFRHAVWRGLFIGPPDVFDFFPAENVRGCPSSNSIVPLGTLVYYLGEDGFYRFDGAQSVPIGADKFDAWFWKNVNQGFLYNVVGAADVPNKAILWAFPSLLSADGISDTMLIYRWDIQRASYAYLGPDAVEWLLRSLSFGVTLDGFFGLGFTDLDTIPASLDSPVWIGGAAQLAAVNGSHHLAYFNGPNMAAQVATQTKQLTPGRRSFVQSARPLVDLTSGTPTVAFSARVNLYDPEVFGPAVPPDISGECPQRSDGRYHDGMIALPFGAVWTHISGVDTTFVAGGFR